MIGIQKVRCFDECDISTKSFNRIRSLENCCCCSCSSPCLDKLNQVSMISFTLEKSTPLEDLHKDLVLKAPGSQECVLKMPSRQTRQTKDMGKVVVCNNVQ
ncbi:hypothetical protein TNCV_1158771 [Trichonephila clavipes]|nr:hypothetical protein TNCV_1158771 [Trichonephila clavipes]